jgi:hypothetical protein
MVFVKIAILALLALIFFQDIRSRSVLGVLFPCLVMLFMGLGLLQHRLYADTWQAVLINIGFLVIQFLVVSAYFSIKNAHWINITTGLLGWGDILFLLSIAFYMSVLNFLFFYVASLVGVLLSWLAWQARSAGKDKHIPLAGLQALLLGLFLTTAWWIKPIDITSDDWLLQLINK